MVNITHYASHIIDLTDAMIEHRQGLNKEQFQRIGLINRFAVQFITEFMQNESISAPALLHYLTNEAEKPLRGILSNCKLMISGQAGEMDKDYVDALQEIRECVLAVVEEIQNLCQDIREFMNSIGMET